MEWSTAFCIVGVVWAIAWMVVKTARHELSKYRSDEYSGGL